MATRLSKIDLVEAAATIYGELIEGRSDKEIMTALRMDAETYGEVRKFMLEGHASTYRSATREQTFVEYVIAQRAIIHAINEIVPEFKGTKQLGSIVGALRLRSDIEERIITRGQEFGVFKKTAERKEIVAGILHADMSNKELVDAILKNHKTFVDLAKKYGDGDFASLPSPSALHYGESAFTAKGETIDDDDEALVASARLLKGGRESKGSKKHGGRSGKHTGHRERSETARTE